MRYMILIKANDESEADVPPSMDLVEAMGKYNDELNKAGALLAAEGLRASSHGALVRFTPQGTSVIDGPFTETKELIAGFWLIEVKSKDEAIEWARRVPRDPARPDAVYDIEVRRVFDEDFDPATAAVRRLTEGK
ncbi:MAG TPA: YciI family protein [Amycolatopsis sp.]|nr:YciI family protein [Amycolatopsis sp.]